MKRGYTTLEYKSIIRRLRNARPDISLTSDFIIGFPGETEADFEATMKLIEETNFDDSFSFIYSPRPGTPAAELPDTTPYEIKLEAAATPAGKNRTNRRRPSVKVWLVRLNAFWSRAQSKKDDERALRAHR